MKAHQVLVEQLRMYSRDMSNLESANPFTNTQQVLDSLHANQERERKEVEEQIAEEVRHLDDSKASYQNLTEGLQRSGIIIKVS